MDKENNTQVNEWKQREVGALWKKSGKTQNYFSGRVNLENYKDSEYINIVGFSNKGKKNNPTAPDVILYYSEPVNSESSLDLDNGKSEEAPSSQDSHLKSKAGETQSSDEELIDETPF